MHTCILPKNMPLNTAAHRSFLSEPSLHGLPNCFAPSFMPLCPLPMTADGRVSSAYSMNT